MDNQSAVPLFAKHDLTKLSKMLDYSEVYLAKLKLGRKPLPRRFQQNCCKILRRTQEELFGPQEPSDA